MGLHHQLVQAVAHGGNDARHSAELVAALDIHRCLAEVAVLQMLANVHHDFQRVGDRLRDAHAHDEEDHETRDAHHHHRRSGRSGIRFRLLVDGLRRLLRFLLQSLQRLAEVHRDLPALGAVQLLCVRQFAVGAEFHDVGHSIVEALPSLADSRALLRGARLTLGSLFVKCPVLLKILLDFIGVVSEVVMALFRRRNHRQDCTRLHITHQVFRLADFLHLLETLVVDNRHAVLRLDDGRVPFVADGRHADSCNDHKDHDLPEYLDVVQQAHNTPPYCH